MRRLFAVAMIVMCAGPAIAQAPVPKYGEVDTPKTPSEIEAERSAERAYRRSLGNVPNTSGPSDPWGSIRNDGAAKSTAKDAPAKRQKSTATSAK